MKVNRIVKNYIIWIYFLIYPITNAYVPDINLGFIKMTAFRIFLLVPLLYLVHLFIANHWRIKISKESSFMVAYVGFALFNSWRVNNFKLANLVNYVFPVLFIIVIENLDFEEEDFARFFRMLTILAIPVFLATLVQKYVNHSFYSGFKHMWTLDRYTFGGEHFRHASLFRSIDFYQAGVAIGVMCIIFMYLNFEKARLKYLVLCFMMLISTFFTYTRSNWLIPVIGFILFIHFKPWRKKIGYILAVLVFAIIFYIQFLPQLQQSELYTQRVTVGTYEGRFVSLDIYFKHFWGRNILFGFGVESVESDEFKAYGRPEVHNGYVETFFQNGLVGFFLYFAFWYYLFKRSRIVYKYTGNGVFLVFIAVFLVSNFVFKFISMAHYGYHMMIFYLHMCYQVQVKAKYEVGRNTVPEVN